MDYTKLHIADTEPVKRKVKDPIRYPKVIEPLEKQMKDSFILEMNKMLVDVTKKIVEFKTESNG